MDILIRGGALVTPEGVRDADLRVSGGRIAAIGAGLCADGARVIDAAGRLVFPGFIDPHTHFEMDTGAARTADSFAQGTRAAVCGGTTTVLDFATQERGGSLAAALEAWRRKAEGVSACHYGFHMAVTDWNPPVAAELPALTAAGVTSYKLYMAYDALRVSDDTALAVVRAAAAQGAVVGMHCEVGEAVDAGVAAQRTAGNCGPAGHPRSRPNAVEAEAVERWLAVARAAGAAVYIVHLSARESLDAVRRARAAGQRVYVETCPQYLVLTEEAYALPGFEGAKFVLSPPLRGAEDVAALWRGVESGEIDTIGTDHCAFDFGGAKQQGRGDFSKIPNGMPGVEHRGELVFTFGVAAGRISPVEMARLLSEHPARLFGLYPRKGVLQVGADADVVVWNPARRRSISAAEQVQHVDYTPYEGVETVGGAEVVLVGGDVAVEDYRLIRGDLGRYAARGAAGFWR